MRASLKITSLAIVSLVAAAPSYAQGTWTIGAIVQAETGYYVGHDDEASLLPYIAYEADRFELSLSDGLSWHVFQTQTGPDSGAQISLRLAPRFEPDFSDDAIFKGLKRDTALEAGIAGRFQSGAFFTEAEALADISDTHDGYEATAFVGLQYGSGAFSIEGGVGTRYRSGALNRHLFGVSASEANASRDAFRPGDETTAFASITGVYALNDNVALVGQVSYEDLGDMQSSPLVEKGQTTSAALGILYQF